MTRLILCLISIVLLGNSLKVGVDLYRRGDFSGARSALARAFQSAKSNSEKGQILKQLGIVQYTEGQTAQAGASFKKALGYDRSLNVTPRESLDGSVVGFFDKQKRSFLARKQPVARQKAPAGPTSRSRQPTTRSLQKKKATYLIVKSNAQGATVMVDGILAGKTNQAIEADPGLSVISVSQSGYNARKVKGRILAGRSNSFQINLSKAKRPEKRSVTNKPAPVRQANKPKKRSGGAPDPGADLFSEPDYEIANDRDLRGEFNRDTGGSYGLSGSPQAPYPGYGGQPAYPQPVYPQPAYPVYPAYPYPQPYAYPQPPAAPPVSPPPPPPGYSDQPSGSADYALPPQSRTAQKRSRRLKAKKRSNPSVILALAPFGAGQFQNEDYLLGAAVGGLQIGALTYYFLLNQDADAAIAKSNEFSAKPDSEVSEDPDEAKAMKSQFKEQSDTFAADNRNQANMYLGGFLLIWAAGATHAVLNMGGDGSHKSAEHTIRAQEHRIKMTILPNKQRELGIAMLWDYNF